MSVSTLCLACSSSLPPRSTAKETFFTPCCQQPICSACLVSNPRLARYNPCLLCLAGVDAVGTKKGSRGSSLNDKNINGAVRDEDMFVLGDDDEEDDAEDDHSEETQTHESVSPLANGTTEVKSQSTGPQRAQYHIKRGDTLQGIVFKFGVNREELCRLNKLPLSTLSTTPHLLHTRSVLLLPSSARIKDPDTQGVSFIDELDSPAEPLDEERAVRRAREKAEKRLQTVTKEVDWAIAKAYVALAEVPGEEEAYAAKIKEDPTMKRLGNGSTLEAVAVDRYLDDLEWEANEIKAGRGVSIPPIPSFTMKG